MISDYFELQWRLARMRSTCVGPHLDDFSTTLTDAGYSHFTIRGYLRAADHVGAWADRHRIALSTWDDELLVRFARHLTRCRCIKSNKGIFGDAIAGVRLLMARLRARGVIAPAVVPMKPSGPAIAAQFAEWILQHRGVAATTAARYQRVLLPFLEVLGEKPKAYTVAAIRRFVIQRLHSAGRGETRATVTALRAFLRFLVAERRVRAGLQHCVPTVPQWRLSSLPRYLDAPDVDRVVQSCDRRTAHGLRDHAILLLLARLGLRGGDIVRMSIDDLDWRGGTLKVSGKGRREARLPVPQDVGDAILAYLKRGRPRTDSERLFLTVVAPIRPFATPATISDIVRVALVRAGIKDPPSRGAHLLRHSAATAMLRSGGSLETIATVLRHRSSEMTAHYAKVELAMLEQVAQPWPGGSSC
jgi:integrase/recombinase XerD